MNTTFDLGRELKRSVVPQKYCNKSSLIGDLLPSAVIFLLIEVYSCLLMNESFGIISFIIGFVTYIGFMTALYFAFAKIKKSLATTYMTVCENGIYGVYSKGISTQEYCIPYSDIKSFSSKKDYIRIVSASSGAFLQYLEDAVQIAEIIGSRKNDIG